MARRRRLITQGYIPDSHHENELDHDHCLMMVWMIRHILSSDRYFRCFFTEKNGFDDEDVRNFLMLQDMSEDDTSSADLKKRLQQELKRYESYKGVKSDISSNIKLLNKRIYLTKLEQEILQYAVLVEDASVWRDLFRNVGIKTERQFFNVLAVMLKTSYLKIKSALSSNSVLRQSGMITLDKGYFDECKFGLLDGLEVALMTEHHDEKELLKQFLLPAEASSISLQDYPHASQEIDVMAQVLTSSIQRAEKGVNILLYGCPGSGKTELARLIAALLNVTLFEVQTSDNDGDSLRPAKRLQNYRLCQQLLSHDKQSMLLFDEVEDVFPSRSFSFFGMETKSGENKGWMNKLLEENKTPALWLCNAVSQIDPAFLRRFDYVMELNTPPKAVRRKMIESYFSGIDLDEAFKDRLASHDKLSPAQISKAASMAKRLSASTVKLEDALEHIVTNTLKVMDHKPLPKAQKHATSYDLNFLNTSMDVAKLIAGMAKRKRGNLCFYGAPGTGKTALAAHIAEQLDMPLLSKQASDILDMYVGGTEKNIAAMFAEAKAEKAVLILDEADSLLRDRQGANRSWEVTQVNELLVQMENFEGIFICSTNLMDDLDQASLRRFAIKMEFHYLKPEQAVNMLKQECVGKLSPQDKHTISMMTNLAPGDFAAVKKRLDILGEEATADAIIQELKSEVMVKRGGSSNSIGFIH